MGKRIEDKGKYAGLTLEEAINSIDTRVKIGTDKGESFLFCGSIERFWEDLEELNRDRHEFMQKRWENAQEAAKKAVANPHADVSDYTKNLTRLYKNIEDIKPTWEGYQTYVTRQFAEVARLTAVVPKRKEQFDNFKPFQDREVKLSYDGDHPTEKNVTILIVEGYESGGYWDIEEYEAAKGKEKE